MLIRKARLFDTPKIIPLTKRFYPQTVYSKVYEFDEETVGELIQNLVASGIVLVVEDAGQLVGIISATIQPFLFNKNYVASGEVIWYVMPEYQSGGVGKELLKQADKLIQEAGVKTSQLFLMADSPPVARALYESMGYKLTELIFTKEY